VTGEALSHLKALVIQHFRSDLEQALRSAFRELMRSDMPPSFTLKLAPPQNHRSFPRSPIQNARKGRTSPAAPPGTEKVRPPNRKHRAA